MSPWDKPDSVCSVALSTVTWVGTLIAEFLSVCAGGFATCDATERRVAAPHPFQVNSRRGLRYACIGHHWASLQVFRSPRRGWHAGPARARTQPAGRRAAPAHHIRRGTGDFVAAENVDSARVTRLPSEIDVASCGSP